VTAIAAEGGTLLIDAGVAIIAGWPPDMPTADLHRRSVAFPFVFFHASTGTCGSRGQ
jgi:hypothetical protein